MLAAGDTPAAAAAGKFADEIVQMTTTMGILADKDSGRLFTKEVTIAADEGIRADTTYEGVAESTPHCRAASSRQATRAGSSRSVRRPAS